MQFVRKHVMNGQYSIDVRLNSVHFSVFDCIVQYFSFGLGTRAEDRDGWSWEGAGNELGRGRGRIKIRSNTSEYVKMR